MPAFAGMAKVDLFSAFLIICISYFSATGILMKVTVFGSGYVGLVTGACLAEVGNDVVCMDVDAVISFVGIMLWTRLEQLLASLFFSDG